ncbi:hypothetical protein B0J14DRAFT_693318 [Halenospora varia]|nr:hypothetical protein B0J14DRAFT_693318 [Halenospora varia]
MDALLHAVESSQSSQTSSQPTSTRTATSSPHVCRICRRTYDRADHLNRHLKSHQNARMHKCTRCPKSFNRADLLNRHQAGHDRRGPDWPMIERTDRVAAACSGCVLAKAKCQDQRPCTRCQKKGLACEIPSSAPAPTSDQPLADNNPFDFGDSQPNQDSITVGTQQNYHSYSIESGISEIVSAGLSTGGSAAVHQTHESPRRSYFEGDSAIGLTPGIGYNPFSTTMIDATFNQNMGFIPQDAFFSQDIDFGMWDIDLDNIDFSMFGPVSTTDTEQNSMQVNSNPPRQRPSDASKRYAAFERSPWVWKPTHKDQGMNDHHNLNLNEDAIPSVLSPNSGACSSDDFSNCNIGQKQRDQILALLFSLRHSPIQALQFPSLSLLNSIIQVYFVQENFKLDNLVHTATFEASKSLPQLIIAILSAGCSSISVDSIWKMGIALQEVTRLTVANYWEENNSNTRNLQALQAFMICLDVGLWSGIRRNMEIAESFGQPLIIMMRRAGAFAARDSLSTFIPTYEDSKTVLEAKWTKWAEIESFKRLVLHLFIHDTHASAGLQKPPLIVFSELKFPLPAARNVWLAKSAIQWRTLFLSSQSENPLPTFLEAMQSPNLLLELSPKADIGLTTTVLIHGYWGQIWSLIEARKFFPDSKRTHQLWLHTSHAEIYQDMSSLRSLVPSLIPDCTEVVLIFELFQMILHVTLEDLQRFAGKFGEEEARKANESFAIWASTQEARMAIWHAGQVLRAARQLSPAKLRGFTAIAVYFAALALWIYGIMLGSMTLSPNRSPVLLNNEETMASRHFRSSGQGAPGLELTNDDADRGREFVELSDTDKILNVARDIYRNNFPDLDGPLPPLVENLGSLLRDLGDSPGSRVSRAPSKGPA